MNEAAAATARLRDAGVPDILARRLAEAWPYPDLPSLCAASDHAIAALAHAELRSALEAIAEPEAQHADEGTREAARLALTMYRDRFGYPFVSGIETPTAEELLMRVRIRLGNEPEPEWRAAREHLRRLMRLRLTRFGSAAAEAE